MQAVNEELVTLNAGLHGKIEELSAANNDLDNYLSSSSIATIFLNREFLITRCSRSTTRIFHLIPSGVGRSLGDLTTQLQYDRILTDATDVLENLSTYERMVETNNGLSLFMRISPYKTVDNVIDGVIMGFADVTEQRRAERRLEEFQELFERFPMPLVVFDQDAKGRDLTCLSFSLGG